MSPEPTQPHITDGLIRLTRDRFFHGDAPGQPCPYVIDLTGLGRILVYGPFITLPAGLWSATIELDVCADAARRPFRIDFAAEGAVSQAPFRAKEPGRLAARVQHELAASSLVEFRLWVLRPTFHGELRFLGASLERSRPRQTRQHGGAE